MSNVLFMCQNKQTLRITFTISSLTDKLSTFKLKVSIQLVRSNKEPALKQIKIDYFFTNPHITHVGQ